MKNQVNNSKVNGNPEKLKNPSDFEPFSQQGWWLQNGDVIKESERNYIFHIQDGEVMGELVRPINKNQFNERTYEKLREDWFYIVLDRIKEKL